MTNSDKILREIKAELKKLTASHPNAGAVEDVLKLALTDIRKIVASDRVYVSQELIEGLAALAAHLRATPAAIDDETRRHLELVDSITKDSPEE